MAKSKKALAWIEEGYKLFAADGIDGVQVERLARILQSNKSSFYHFFGDLECFSDEMLLLHDKKVDDLLKGIQTIKVLDPDYLQLLIDHSVTVMFQVQLTRHKNQYSMYFRSLKVDKMVDEAVSRLWSNFLGLSNNSDLAIRFYRIVRDMFYTRISFDNLNYPFLHDLASEAKLFASDLKNFDVIATKS